MDGHPLRRLSLLRLEFADEGRVGERDGVYIK
jgi:hypothetical protein